MVVVVIVVLVVKVDGLVMISNDRLMVSFNGDFFCIVIFNGVKIGLVWYVW